MTGYADLGVTPVINASATLTRLGGSRMPKPVMDAMAAGTEAFVDLVELQRRAGERIADADRQRGLLHLLRRGGRHRHRGGGLHHRHATRPQIARLPHFDGPPAEVIVHRAHRNGYDHAARQTGATLVEIGMAHSTQRWELEAAITPRTACVLYFAGAHYATGALPLSEVDRDRARARRAGAGGCRRPDPAGRGALAVHARAGADIAIFSGGKGLRGPQSSGLVLGRREIVEACCPNGSPNQSIGRPMKVGKEEMLGILAAVEWSLSQDEAAVLAGYEASVQGWLRRLAGHRGRHGGARLPERGRPAARPRHRPLRPALPALARRGGGRALERRPRGSRSRRSARTASR